MNWQRFLTPWTFGGAIFGFLLGIAAIVSLVVNRRQIGAALARVFQRLFSPVGFFSLVIVVFMIISVLESGEFFDRNITHGAIFGLLGYALALGFDLVSIVCLQARLSATRMRDERGAQLNLVGVCICALVSAFANVAGALQGYQPADLARTPGWIQFCAPWTSIVFPLLIVVLSMATDHILDHTPTRGIDTALFRARERKRVEMLQVRLETERELLALDIELATLRQQREQAGGHVQRREWFFWRWLRPVVTPSASATDPRTIVDQAVQATQAALEARFNGVDATLHTLASTANELLATLRTQVSTHAQEQGNALSGDQKAHAQEQGTRPPARLRAHRTQAPRIPARVQPGGLDKHTETEDGTNTTPTILSAFERLGAHATDTEVAREVGCSRTTVARWRKRFIAQGHLPEPAANAPILQITESAG